MNLLRLRLKLLIESWEFQLSLILMFFFVCIGFFISMSTSFGKYSNLVVNAYHQFVGFSKENYAVKGAILNILMPFLSSLSVGGIYLAEKRMSLSNCLLLKVGNQNYLKSLIFTAFFSGFMIAFIPFALNLIMNLIAFPSDSSQLYYSSISFDNYNFINVITFKNLFFQHPMLYNLLYLFLFSTVSGFIATLVICLSLIYTKSKLLVYLLVPSGFTIITVLLNFFHLPSLSIVSYIDAAPAITNLNFIFFALWLIIFSLFIFITYQYRSRIQTDEI